MFGQHNELIYKLLDFTGVLRIHLGFYKSLSSLQVFLGVVFALPTTTANAIALPTRWPYSIVLTIVHIDGILSYPSTLVTYAENDFGYSRQWIRALFRAGDLVGKTGLLATILIMDLGAKDRFWRWAVPTYLESHKAG